MAAHHAAAVHGVCSSDAHNQLIASRKLLPLCARASTHSLPRAHSIKLARDTFVVCCVKGGTVCSRVARCYEVAKRRHALGASAATRLPQVGPHQRLRTMRECLFDRHDHNRRGLFAIDGEPPLEVCILGNLCAPVDPIGLIHPGHEENQCNTRVLNKVLEAIDSIVTATVRYEQRPTVFCDLHEAGLIALGRAVETLSASCCKNQKW